MSDYATKNYAEAGGDNLVIGGILDVQDGGEIDLGANAKVTISGTDVVIAGLPTAAPAAGSGILWNNAGVLTIA